MGAGAGRVGRRRGSASLSPAGRGATIVLRMAADSSSPSGSTRRSRAPGDVAPMWPIPRPDAFDSPDHLFEPTWGGHRVLAFVGPAERAGTGDVRIVDPTGLDLASRLPELAGLAVRVNARSAVLDGELVVVDGARPRRRRRAPGAPQRARRPAGRATSCSTSSTSMACGSSGRRSRSGARRSSASSGRATRWSSCRRSRARAGRSTTRCRPRGSPACSRGGGRRPTCRACAAGCGGRSPRRRRERRRRPMRAPADGGDGVDGERASGTGASPRAVPPPAVRRRARRP